MLEKTLQSPLDCKRSNQSILKEINPEYPLEGLMLMLKFQYFGLMWRVDSFEKTLMLGKIEGRKTRGQQRTRWLDGITDSMDMNVSKLRETVGGQRSLMCCSPWGHKQSDTTDWLSSNNHQKNKYLNIIKYMFIYIHIYIFQKLSKLHSSTVPYPLWIKPIISDTGHIFILNWKVKAEWTKEEYMKLE